MSYKNPNHQKVINRAKARALSRLMDQHPDDYARYYEEAMRAEGFVRMKRGPHRVGGRGGMVWVRIEEVRDEPETDIRETIREFIADSDRRRTKPGSLLGEAVRLLRRSIEEDGGVTPRD